MKKHLVLLLMIVIINPRICMSESLLLPTMFPKTYQDVDFIDRAKIAHDGYEAFFDLDPYNAIEIMDADAGAVDEIAADELTEPTDDFVPDLYEDNDLQTSQNTQNVQNLTTSNDDGNKYCATNYNAEIPSGQKIPLGKPVRASDYRKCSKYGWRKFGTKNDFHHGFDIGCTIKHYNQPVFTPADGYVERVQPNRRGSSAGNYIVIKHSNGFKTKYMHLNKMFVRVGDRVRAGCQIATIGNTGGAKIYKEQFKNNPHPTMSKNASHLHYEIHYTGKSPVSINGRTINIEWGRTKNPNAVHDYSINPEPFLLF